MSTTTTPLAYSIEDAAKVTGLSKSTLERAINSGRLRAKFTSADTDGNGTGKRLILASALQDYLDGLVDA